MEEYRGKKRRGLENLLSMSFGRLGHISKRSLSILQENLRERVLIIRVG